MDLQQELEASRIREDKLKCKIADIRTFVDKVDKETEEYSTSQQTHKSSTLKPKESKRMSFWKSYPKNSTTSRTRLRVTLD